MVSITAPITVTRPPLLLVEPVEGSRDLYAKTMAADFTVTAVGSMQAGLAQLARMTPDLVVTELTLPDGDGVVVCRTAKSLDRAPAVVVVTSVLQQVPDAIVAGCDSVLVKPIAPAVLIMRLRRLRERAEVVRLRSEDVRRRANTALMRSFKLKGALNREWPDMECPRCHASGPVSFDFASYRRMWCACLACKAVWIAPRRER